MKSTIIIDIDTDRISLVTGECLAQYWQVAQANPAPHGDQEAGQLVDRIGSEIIRRWLMEQPPVLYYHQPTDYALKTLDEHGGYIDGEWQPIERGQSKEKSFFC